MADHRRRSDEDSRRILDRVAKESDPSGSFAMRTTRKVQKHMRADDADQDDAIEVWGTRIGRVIGVILLFVLAGWLISFFLGR